MNYVRFNILILSIFIFIGCTKEVNVEKVKIEKVVEKKKTTSSNAYSYSNSTQKARILNKSIAMQFKLRKKCNIHYVTWKDRLHNDLVLQTKLLKICRKANSYTNGYILHSTSAKGIYSFIKDKDMYISFTDSKEKIYKFLSKIKSGNNITQKNKYKSSSIVQTIDDKNKLILGKPYIYKTKKQK